MRRIGDTGIAVRRIRMYGITTRRGTVYPNYDMPDLDVLELRRIETENNEIDYSGLRL